MTVDMTAHLFLAGVGGLTVTFIVWKYVIKPAFF